MVLNVSERRLHRGLGAFLKQFRARISSDARALGPFLRSPQRIGTPVSQEEIAEAAGISRQWYVFLESSRDIRVSPDVLGRIADALMLDPSERSSLLDLVVPELGIAKLRPQSEHVLEAFATIRSLARRLWTATSEADMLSLVREYLAMQFSPDVSLSAEQNAQGSWKPLPIGSADACRRLQSFHSFMHGHSHEGPRRECLHPVFGPPARMPGEVVTRSEQTMPNREYAVQFGKALALVNWRDMDFILGHVQSRIGFTARIAAIYNSRHDFSEQDRATMSTIADLTSFALSPISAPQAPRNARAVNGWESLTAMERRVAVIVGEGHTNREAAARLELSPNTIASHLRSVFGKLAVNSRVQLARELLRIQDYRQ
jgi:DNA-binding CsgD family transcriptional regulator/transcriptional regulator with XRE-family HTH domain